MTIADWKPVSQLPQICPGNWTDVIIAFGPMEKGEWLKVPGFYFNEYAAGEYNKDPQTGWFGKLASDGRLIQPPDYWSYLPDNNPGDPLPPPKEKP